MLPFTTFYTRQNVVNEVDVVGNVLLLRLFCQKNEVENEVFISINCHNVTQSTNVSTLRLQSETELCAT